MMILAMFGNVAHAGTQREGERCASNSDCVGSLVCVNEDNWHSYCRRSSQG